MNHILIEPNIPDAAVIVATAQPGNTRSEKYIISKLSLFKCAIKQALHFPLTSLVNDALWLDLVEVLCHVLRVHHAEHRVEHTRLLDVLWRGRRGRRHRNR